MALALAYRLNNSQAPFANGGAQEISSSRPYCVTEGGFRLLVEGDDGTLSCDNCGHAVAPNDPERECACPKCEQLRTASNRLHAPAKQPS